MYEASFQGLVRTLLIIALVYYGIKILARIFLPYLMKYFIQKVSTNFQQKYNHNQQDQSTSTHTQEVPKKKQKEKVGEYIDYEEID